MASHTTSTFGLARAELSAPTHYHKALDRMNNITTPSQAAAEFRERVTSDNKGERHWHSLGGLATIACTSQRVVDQLSDQMYGLMIKCKRSYEFSKSIEERDLDLQRQRSEAFTGSHATIGGMLYSQQANLDMLSRVQNKRVRSDLTPSQLFATKLDPRELVDYSDL